MKKTIALVLTAVFLLTACTMSIPPVELKTTFAVYNEDGMSLTGDLVNCDVAENKSVIYNRDFKYDGEFLFKTPSLPEKYTALTVLRLDENLNVYYEVHSVSTEEGKEFDIPANGFVIFTPVYRVFGEGETVSVRGYDKSVSQSDMLSYATLCALENKEITLRRINMANPKVDMEDGKIYYLDKNSSASVPQNATVLSLEKSDGGFKVTQVQNFDAQTDYKATSPTLVFTGEYNIAFAENWLGEGKGLSIKMLDKANSQTDLPTVSFGNKSIVFESEFINSDDPYKEGVYLYTPDYKGEIIPQTGFESVAVTVIGGYAVLMSEEYSCNAVPKANGYTLVFPKDEIPFKAGDEVNQNLFDINKNGEDPYYSLTVLDIDGFNTVRGENMLVVYWNKTSTETNEYGYEIRVNSDGIAVSDSYSGNSEISQNGFVLSGHGKAKDALVKVYTPGLTAILNRDVKKVLLVNSPQTAVYKLDDMHGTLQHLITQSKNQYLNLDYASLDESCKALEEMCKNGEGQLSAGNIAEVFNLVSKAQDIYQNAQYAAIPSGGVGNRSVWYRPSEKNDDQVKATVETLKELGITSLYLETWYEGYCIGSKVEVEGYDLVRNKDYDVLEAFVRICHQNGIEVHSWVHNFFVGFYYEGGNRYHNPIFAEERFNDRYVIDKAGNDRFYYTANGNYWYFLNPNIKENRDMVLALYKELLTKYDIDGLHLDYNRFPEPNLLSGGPYDFGYNQDIVDGFKAKTGITGDPAKFKEGTSRYNAWVQYRCDIITSFIGEVYDMAMDVDPDIWLSAATYPDIAAAKKDIMQDVKTFAAKEYFDEIFSMSYGVDNKYVLSTVDNYINAIDGRAFYSAGIAAFLETSRENFAKQLYEVVQDKADGVAVFALEYMKGTPYYNAALKGAFREKVTPATRYSDSAVAQLDYICDMLDNLAPVFEYIDQEDIEHVKKLCKDLKEEIGNMTPSHGIEKRINWCLDTAEAFENAAASLSSITVQANERAAVTKPFEDFARAMRLHADRLSKRR